MKLMGNVEEYQEYQEYWGDVLTSIELKCPGKGIQLCRLYKDDIIGAFLDELEPSEVAYELVAKLFENIYS